MLETLDAAAVRRWCDGGLEALRAHQREIDELNVFPVPDGDTGTNLVLTLTAAREALTAAVETRAGSGDEPGPGVPMRRMARGALLGARGNSGVIVSQILRGMADTFTTTVAVRGGELARALRTATDAAYAAVARPVEGTVLSVVAGAAEAAGRIGSDNLVTVAREAARAAAEALAHTPRQLPELARAGVVDAGGRGLCLLLDALVAALDAGGAPASSPAVPLTTGASATRSSAAGVPAVPSSAAGASATWSSASGVPAVPSSAAGAGAPFLPPAVVPVVRESSPAGHGRPGDSGPFPGSGYEVQFLLDATEDAVRRLRVALGRIGDSLVVVGTGEGDPPTWNVHVHVSEAGPAIEAGIEAGRPHRITVTPLTGHRHDSHRHDNHRHDSRGAVVVAAGDGLAALFEAEGAVVLDRNPSTAEILAAVAATGAGSVVLLPNDANTHAVAVSAAREAEAQGVRVSVVPTRSPVQALAALAVRDPQRPFADDVIAMAEAAGACRSGEVCTAARDAFTVAGQCRAGDLLGLVDGEVHVIGGDLTEVSRLLLDRMLGGGGELVTLVLGADAPPGFEEELRGHVHRTWPFIELQCYAGGQPRYHLLAGVE
ncbi:DAK2 domain-containing protein [Actinoplanes couchii]|uniref:DAK2 domain-containing protein n=1 Tax=Actinoplanes couchii TaxID=403638 RepID=UPI0031D7BDAF